MARRTDSADLPRVFRADRIDVSTAHLLPPVRQADGSLLVSGYVARPGVLVYRRPDGSVQRELVTADELKASAAGIARKTLTVEHPAEDVSPATVGTVGVGDVGSRVQVIQDTGYVQVDMVIRRQDGLAAFAAGIQELSPGYSCGLDITPGVHPEFGPYDAIQVGREYNHLALCEAARGGPTIRARADSADVAIQIPSPSEPPVKTLTLAAPLLLRLGVLANKPVRLDADGAPDLAAAGEALASLEANAPAAAAALASVEQMKKDIETLKATVAAKEAELATLTSAPVPGPAEIEAEIESAAEGDPMLDAAGAPMALPAEMPKDAASAGPIRMDAIRRAVARVSGERAQLHVLAKRARLDSAAVEKMGLKQLRKAVLKSAAPHARQDGSRDYDRATIDHLAAQRTDSTGSDAFAGFFNSAADPSADRKDAAKHEDAALPSPISDAYNRKWGLGVHAKPKT